MKIGFFKFRWPSQSLLIIVFIILSVVLYNALLEIVRYDEYFGLPLRTFGYPKSIAYFIFILFFSFIHLIGVILFSFKYKIGWAMLIGLGLHTIFFLIFSYSTTDLVIVKILLVFVGFYILHSKDVKTNMGLSNKNSMLWLWFLGLLIFGFLYLIGSNIPVHASSLP